MPDDGSLAETYGFACAWRPFGLPMRTQLRTTPTDCIATHVPNQLCLSECKGVQATSRLEAVAGSVFFFWFGATAPQVSRESKARGRATRVFFD